MTTCQWEPGCLEEATFFVRTGETREDLLDIPVGPLHVEDAVSVYGFEALYAIDAPEGIDLPTWEVICSVTVPTTITVKASSYEDAMELALHEVPLDALKEYGHLDGYSINDLVVKALTAKEV